MKYLIILLLAAGCGQTLTETGAVPRNAVVCSVVQTASGALITCPDGTLAEIINGSVGKDGSPGSIITPVKLCANDSSGFPEYGFLLDSTLYAVYWDPSKGAFWAKITPGNYMSTNGTSCQFTVHTDGSITQ